MESDDKDDNNNSSGRSNDQTPITDEPPSIYSTEDPTAEISSSNNNSTSSNKDPSNLYEILLSKTKEFFSSNKYVPASKILKKKYVIVRPRILIPSNYKENIPVGFRPINLSIPKKDITSRPSTEDPNSSKRDLPAKPRTYNFHGVKKNIARRYLAESSNEANSIAKNEVSARTNIEDSRYSKDLSISTNPKLPAARYYPPGCSAGPSTSRESSSMRPGPVNTFERNSTDYSYSRLVRPITSRSLTPPLEVQSPEEPVFEPIKCDIGKGKGIGKGKLNLERALKLTQRSTVIETVPEHYSTSQSKPMDLSIRTPLNVIIEQDTQDYTLEIDEPFEDAIVTAGQSMQLVCKVIGKVTHYRWFKNGQVIVTDSRIQTSAEEENQVFKLRINITEIYDHGIYRFEVGNKFELRFCYGNIIIADADDITSIFTGFCPRYALDVFKHLEPVTVLDGNSLELTAVFKSKSTGGYRWFKNDRRIFPDHRSIIMRTEYSPTLYIENTCTADTGIYTVVAITEFGIASSSAAVHVYTNVNMRNLQFFETKPRIDEMLGNAVLHEGEEFRIFCKIRPNYRSCIRWFHYNNPIENRVNVRLSDYGDGYLGLRIYDAKKQHSGVYTIKLYDRITASTEESISYVYILRDFTYREVIKVGKHLMSCVTSSGCSLALDCQFDIKNLEYYFVRWYIGHYRIQHSDSRFRVATKNGHCLLKILRVEPGMRGEVVCELHTLVANANSVVRAFTTCNLALVPSSVILEQLSLEVKQVPSVIMCHKYSKWCTDGIVETSETGFDMSEFSKNQPPIPANETLFYIEYCRLEDDYYYYLFVSKEKNDDQMIIMAVDMSESDNEVNQMQVINIEWHYQSSKSDEVIWYRVDHLESNGLFVNVATTMDPQLIYINPTINQSAKFRISTVVPDDVTIPRAASITNRPNNDEGPAGNFIPCPMYQYRKRYKTFHQDIGKGAFGTVCIAEHISSNRLYAVKTSKIKNSEDKETCLNEFGMLRLLRHPQIANMFDAYRNDREFKIVMEWFRGGELYHRIMNCYDRSEQDVIPYIRQICSALLYMHNKNIVHLDLKPENIMCVHPNSRQIKLIDFGMALQLYPWFRRSVNCGTATYVSPEVVNDEPPTVKSDMWSLGVIVFMMLSGKPPFIIKKWPKESVKIIKGQYNYNNRAFRNVSNLAKDFIDNLLVVDVKNRMSSERAIQHLWLCEGPNKRPLKNLPNIATTKPQCKRARTATVAELQFLRPMSVIYPKRRCVSTKSDPPLRDHSNQRSLNWILETCKPQTSITTTPICRS